MLSFGLSAAVAPASRRDNTKHPCGLAGNVGVVQSAKFEDVFLSAGGLWDLANEHLLDSKCVPGVGDRIRDGGAEAAAVIVLHGQDVAAVLVRQI